MAITLVGSTSTSVINTSPFTLDLPECQENDVVIVAVGSGTVSDYDIGVATSGYSEVADLYSDDSYDANLSVSWKRMGATPDTTVSITGVSGSAAYGTAAIAYVLRGVSTSTVLDVAATTATGGNSPVPNAAAITPVSNGAWVVVVGCGSNLDSSVTAPSGYSDQVQVQCNANSKSTVVVARKQWSGTGSEDPAAWTDWTADGSESYYSWAAVTLAIRPVMTLTPPTAELALTGATPAIAVSPATVDISLTTAAPAPGTAVSVSPSSGGLTITGGEPSVSNLPICMPITVQMRITGLVPVIEQFMEIAGTTPNMRGSFTFADTVEFSGNTAQMQGEWAFVYPHDFAGETPASSGVFEFGAEFEGNSPGMSGAFVLEEIQYADFVGNTPVMQGAFEFGSEFSGKTPIMQGAFEIEEETYGAFDVKSPAMFGGFEFSQEMDFSGKTPAMEGAFTGEMEQYGSFTGLSPAMTGSFDFTTNELNFSGLSPAMQTAFALSVETTMVFSGNTPPTIGTVFIGVDISTDITTTSDEIIRFRRNYDNG